MRAIVTATIAAIEAVAVALATLLIIALFAFLVWWLSFGLSAEPTEVLAAAGSTWLLAHFVPISFEIGPESMQMFGFAPEKLSFPLSLVPLGLTAVSVAFAARSGWRFGNRGGSGAAGVLGGAIGFGVAAVAIEVFSMPSDRPFVLVALAPATMYGLASALPFVMRASHEQHGWWLRTQEFCEVTLGRMRIPRPVVIVRRLGDALRLGAMLLAGYVALAAAGLAVAIVIGYTGIIATSQALQLDIWGAVMMFVVQLALLPTCIVWSGAWFTGAGFSVGLGSSASPFGALLGPMPGIPLLSAIPDGWGSLAALAPLLLVLAGLAAGSGLGNVARRLSLPEMLGVVVVASLLSGLGVAAINSIASGSLGPGRLEVVGPDVWIVAGFAAAELGVGCLLGAFAARADLAKRAIAVPGDALRRFGGADDLEEFALHVEQPTQSATLASVTQAPATLSRAEPAAEATSQPNGGTVIALPISGSTGLHDDADEHLAVPLELDVSAVTPEPAEPAREPELFDQQETDVVEPLVDPLVEAYSWDSLPDEQTDTKGEQSKPIWRWPGRKG